MNNTPYPKPEHERWPDVRDNAADYTSFCESCNNPEPDKESSNQSNHSVYDVDMPRYSFHLITSFCVVYCYDGGYNYLVAMFLG